MFSLFGPSLSVATYDLIPLPFLPLSDFSMVLFSGTCIDLPAVE